MTYKSRKTASQQLTGIGFVVGLHLIAIYMVASGLAHQAVDTMMGPIETKVIEEAKTKQDEPPPPPPKLQTPPPYVPPPDLDVAIDAPPPVATTAISNVSNKPAPAPVAAPAIPDTEPRLDPRNRRNQITDADYPSQSIRLREEGVPVVYIWVLEDGTVGEVKLLQGCGVERLDEAAIKLVKRFRYSPAIKDGKPIAAWKTQPVTFKLTTR